MTDITAVTVRPAGTDTTILDVDLKPITIISNLETLPVLNASKLISLNLLAKL